MNIEQLVEAPKTELGKIKIQCLNRFYQMIKDNGYELPPMIELSDLVMYHSTDLPDNRDFAELGAWMKERYLLTEMAPAHLKLSLKDLVDDGLKSGERLLRVSNKPAKKKKSFLSGIFGGGDDNFK